MIAEPATVDRITRTTDHTYIYQGRRYPGVTGVLKVIDKSGPLMSWAARQTAEAALGMMEGEDPLYWPLASALKASGPEGVVKLLTSRSSWKRDTAAELGTNVHRMAEAIVSGDPIAEMMPHAVAYAEWWKNSGWSLRAVEAMVVHTTFGYGGTLDLLCRDRDGRTVLADIKTGKAIYKEAVLQLTAYGMAELLQTDSGVYRMPAVDRYVVLHVTEHEVREVEIAVDALERVAWAACLDLNQWTESMKGKKF